MKLEDIVSSLIADDKMSPVMAQAANNVRQFGSAYDQVAAAVTSSSGRMESAATRAFANVGGGATRMSATVAGAAAQTIDSLNKIEAAANRAAAAVVSANAAVRSGGVAPPPTRGNNTAAGDDPIGRSIVGAPALRGNNTAFIDPATGTWRTALPGGVVLTPIQRGAAAADARWGGSVPGAPAIRPGPTVLSHQQEAAMRWGGAVPAAPGLRFPTASADESWRWNWGAAAGGGMFGRILGGPTAGMMGALGGGIGGAAGAVGGAGIGTVLEWGVIKPLQMGAAVAAAGFHAIAEGGHFLVSKIVELGMVFERTKAVFGVIAGSPEAGGKLLSEIRKMAVASPYTSTELYPKAQTLLGMGVSAEQVPAVLSRLGDIAGGDTGRLGRLALAYGQSQAAGRLVGYELRQFTEAGVGIDDFAKAAGMSVRDFRDAMQAPGGSQIGPEVVGRTINMLTSPGGRFSGLSGTINQTVGGQYNALVERLQMKGEEFGAGAFGRYDVAGRIGRLSESFDRLAAGADKAMPAVDEIVKMGDALFEAASNLVGKVGGVGSWEDLTASLAKFGKDDLPEIITGVQTLSGMFLKMVAGAIDVVRVGIAIVASPLQVGGTISKISQGLGGPDILGMGAEMDAFNRAFSQTGHLTTRIHRGGRFLMDNADASGAAFSAAFGAGGMSGEKLIRFGETVGNTSQGAAWAGRQGVSGSTQRWVSEDDPAYSMYPALRTRMSQGQIDAVSGRMRQQGWAGIPLLRTAARAFGVNPASGYNAGLINDRPGFEAMMGVTPGDRAFRTGFLKGSNDPFQDFAGDVGSVQRLRRGVGMLGIPAPMLSAQEGAEALKQVAEKLKKALDIPISPLEKFGKRMEDLDRLQAARNMNRGFNAMLGLGGRDEDINIARMQEFQRDAADVLEQMGKAMTLPTTRYAGSVEVMDLLNQSANETKVWQTDVKAIWQEMERKQAELARDAALFVEELRKLNRNKVIVGPAEEKP